MKGSGWLVAVVLCAMASACGGGGKDCVGLCQAAKDQSCTAIKTDCASFCGALDRVSSAAQCDEKKNAYQDCLNNHPTCQGDANCSSEKSAFTSCGTPYCTANASSADCQTLIANF